MSETGGCDWGCSLDGGTTRSAASSIAPTFDSSRFEPSSARCGRRATVSASWTRARPYHSTHRSSYPGWRTPLAGCARHSLPTSSSSLPSQPPASPSAAVASGRVTVIMLTYNGLGDLEESLRTLHTQSRPPDEIVVVDNASTDGTAAYIRATFPDVRLLAETVNHGFAKGNNVAARAATGDYLVFVN